MNRKVLLCLCLTLFFLNQLKAQYENVWAFGDKAGLDFNSIPPVAIQTNISAMEGCASVSDANGQLLFYTDGTIVWDRNNAIMPNGDNITNAAMNITSSTTQGTLIVPVPGNPAQYYVFSIGCYECGRQHSGKLYYSVVDMRLNNGLGDVMPGKKGIFLDDQLTEQMTAVAGDNCNLWLLVVKRSDTLLKAYNIDFNGLDTIPVLSAMTARGTTGSGGGVIGGINVSPDRKRLGVTQSYLALYDFNAASGEISNPLLLDHVGTNAVYYGICFSPDNSKLYATDNNGVYQFDVSLNNTNAIIASKTFVGTSHNSAAIKRGPDGKVYKVDVSSGSLSVIHKPNLAGTACEFAASGFTLLPGTSSRLGLPNSITLLAGERFYSAYADTADCADSMLLRPHNPNTGNYTWEDGSAGRDRYVYESGTYWVTYQHSAPGRCDQYTDTFKTVLNKIKRTYTTTTFEGMCQTDTFLMQASNGNESNYIWEDGSLGKMRRINKTGIYWVSYQNDSLCEYFADTFHVTYPDPEHKVSFIVDTLICQSDTISFNNTSAAPFHQFDWTFGDGNSTTDRTPVHHYQEKGIYEVLLIGKIGGICVDTARVTIVVDPLIPTEFVTDRDSICIGESISFSHPMNSPTLVQLLWNWGDDSHQVTLEQNSLQHAYEKAGITEVTLLAQFRACPESSFSHTVYLFDLPKVGLGSDSGICWNGSPVTLKNTQPLAEGIHHYLWSTGDTTANLKVLHPGRYSLTVTSEPLGCSTTEFIVITKGCHLNIPNAFSPDGDGINDYFFPRQLLTKTVTDFRMRILNRWGQTLFETTSTEGRGWDGNFNGQEQPAGVYVYIIEARVGGYAESYEGNMTLIR